MGPLAATASLWLAAKMAGPKASARVPTAKVGASARRLPNHPPNFRAPDRGSAPTRPNSKRQRAATSTRRPIWPSHPQASLHPNRSGRPAPEPPPASPIPVEPPGSRSTHSTNSVAPPKSPPPASTRSREPLWNLLPDKTNSVAPLPSLRSIGSRSTSRPFTTPSIPATSEDAPTPSGHCRSPARFAWTRGCLIEIFKRHKKPGRHGEVFSFEFFVCSAHTEGTLAIPEDGSKCRTPSVGQVALRQAN